MAQQSVRYSSWLVGLALSIVGAGASMAQEKQGLDTPPAKKVETKEAKADHAAFQAFLKENKLDGAWQDGPILMDTEEVRKAFANCRVYYTFAAPPRGYIGGAAPSPEILKRDAEARAAYEKHSLRIVVAIQDGKVIPLKKTEDYNARLMPIKSEDDARIAAAAILSLQFRQQLNFSHGPTPVAAKDVKAVKNEKGWSCTMPLHYPGGLGGPRDGWRGEGVVGFDAGGKVTKVTMQVQPVGPFLFPPSPPARPKTPALKESPATIK